MKILVLFYSAYGHVYQMAEAVAEGARQVEGAEVTIKQVPETLPQEVQEKTGIAHAHKAFADIRLPNRRNWRITMPFFSERRPGSV